MLTNSTGPSKATLKKNRTNLVLGLIVFLVVVVLIAIIGWIVLRPEPEIIQGEVEANEVRVSGKLAGRITEFKAEEGQFVQAGDTLVLLSSPELMAKLEQAEAAEDAAVAQNKKAIKGARYEQIEGAFEMWNKAKVGLDIAEKSYSRAKKLFDGEVIPAQKFDEAEAQYHAAIATEKAARSQYNMAMNGAEKEDKMAAQALVNRAKGAVSEVQAYMPETMLTAPISGEISEIYPKQGELVGSGAPIMSIMDLNDCWITFNVREDQLKNMKIGSMIRVSIPALEIDAASFKISYLKALGSYATWKATKTTGDFDRKTFEVRAKPVQKIKDLRPGMTVLMEETEE
jgi:HlyD family secretion protein